MFLSLLIKMRDYSRVIHGQIKHWLSRGTFTFFCGPNNSNRCHCILHTETLIEEISQRLVNKENNYMLQPCASILRIRTGFFVYSLNTFFKCVTGEQQTLLCAAWTDPCPKSVSCIHDLKQRRAGQRARGSTEVRLLSRKTSFDKDPLGGTNLLTTFIKHAFIIKLFYSFCFLLDL